MGSSSVSDFLQAIGKSRSSTHDPWSHASSLLKVEEDVSYDKKFYGKLISMSAILANTGSDPLMMLIQNDVAILIAAYEAACREKEFRLVFEWMYHSWVGGLKMTRTTQGWERRLQAAAGGNYTPEGEFEGYGSDLNFGQDDNQPKSSGGLGKLMQGIRPPKAGGQPPMNQRPGYG